MTTNVPSPSFSALGFVAPSDDAILAGVLQDINVAFGGGLNVTNLETPQGQLASSLAAIISNAYNLFANLTQQMDPAYNYGRMQDAIGRIYFITRNPALPTVVACTVNGAQGVVIPIGAQAQDAAGNIYVCTDGGTFDITGLMTLQFENTITGPIECPAGTLTKIYIAIPGWDSITNPADGSLGQNVESREAFELRRELTVASNSEGMNASILGALFEVPGVLDAYVTDNPTGAPVTINGATILANSIYAVVVGGTDAAVAFAIWSKKSPGCPYTGTTTVTVSDPNPLYAPPPPSYLVKFTRPASLSILFAVSLSTNLQVPADAATQIKNAIIATFNGSNGGLRARIGSKIYASQFYCAINALGSWVQLNSVLIGSANNPGASFTGVIAGTVLTASSVTGTIAVGQTVQGAGLLDGTIIASLGSGSGGAGTYNLSKTQTVSSEAMTSTTPTRNSLQVLLTQVPVIASDNIAVVIS